MQAKTDYFEVENGCIMLTPVRMQQADAVRAKLEALGINDQDVLDAVQWARKSQVIKTLPIMSLSEFEQWQKSS
jgi:uncharacterized Fe-S cluster-containing radical SAM superfamily enzyme